MENSNEQEIIEAINELEIFEPDDLVEFAMYRNCIEKIQRLFDLYKKEKEKNEALEYIENKLMPLAECGYWNYENHTCTHTCRGCDGLHENNRKTNTGILIDKDRYCRLYEDGDFDKDTKIVSVNDLIARYWKGSNNEKQM